MERSHTNGWKLALITAVSVVGMAAATSAANVAHHRHHGAHHHSSKIVIPKNVAKKKALHLKRADRFDVHRHNRSFGHVATKKLKAAKKFKRSHRSLHRGSFGHRQYGLHRGHHHDRAFKKGLHHKRSFKKGVNRRGFNRAFSTSRRSGFGHRFGRRFR